jgi:argininosuccinate lyase
VRHFSDALSRLDECLLKAAALAGSGLPIDREAKAQTFGFARPSPNSKPAVADRDFTLELSACVAIAMTHLSRFCVDVVRNWASQEFRFVKLAEKLRTGWSILL